MFVPALHTRVDPLCRHQSSERVFQWAGCVDVLHQSLDIACRTKGHQNTFPSTTSVSEAACGWRNVHRVYRHGSLGVVSLGDEKGQPLFLGGHVGYLRVNLNVVQIHRNEPSGGLRLDMTRCISLWNTAGALVSTNGITKN